MIRFFGHLSKSLSSIEPTGTGRPPPALFTRKRTGPSSAGSAALKAARDACQSVRSHTTGRTSSFPAYSLSAFHLSAELSTGITKHS